LDSAKEGGYFAPCEYLDAATAEEITADMVALAADLEEYKAEEILPFVTEWLKENIK
jgi:hypothetical protein